MLSIESTKLKISKTKNFSLVTFPMSIKAAVITVSDRCAAGESIDLSGPALIQELQALGADIAATKIVSDDRDALSSLLRDICDRHTANLILTTGGTGFSPRDNTPEATLAVIEREAPGLSEAMRAATMKNTPMAMTSRGISGTCKGTLIINLPGSPKGAVECFAVIKPVLSHIISLLEGKPHTQA